MPGSRRVRIAHTSDVHLDGNALTNSIDGYRNVAEAAFAHVVNTVRDERCDLFLVVGDLFDHSRIKAHDINFVCTQFNKLDCHVVVLPGNHDVHDESSVWNRFDPDKLGPNVHMLLSTEGARIDIDDLDLSIWGKAMCEHSPEYRPLLGAQAKSHLSWNIGLAHGQVVNTKTEYVSSTIMEDEIRDSGFDYLALGHVHVWQDYQLGNTLACYPGSPVKAFATTRGGFFALLTLEDGELTLEKREVPAPPTVEENKHFHFAPGV